MLVGVMLIICLFDYFVAVLLVSMNQRIVIVYN